eukprot:c3154_g1_i1.p1 GENE.c3154_g1_i1~~c3154_g1_i1.p1  ORF type:complete len:343 (+),score=91.44 c3154_g1_i1:50-1030(+)
MATTKVFALMLLLMMLHAEAVTVAHHVTVFGNTRMTMADMHVLVDRVLSKGDVLVSLVSKLKDLKPRDICSKMHPQGPVSYLLGKVAASARQNPVVVALAQHTLNEQTLVQLGAKTTTDEDTGAMGCIVSVIFGVLELVAFGVWIYSVVLVNRFVNLECTFQERVSKEKTKRCNEMKGKWISVTRVLWLMAIAMIAGGGMMALCQFWRKDSKTQANNSRVFLSSLRFRLAPGTEVLELRDFNQNTYSYAILAPEPTEEIVFRPACHNSGTCIVKLNGERIGTDKDTPRMTIPTEIGDIRIFKFEVADQTLPDTQTYTIYVQKVSEP